MHNVRRGIRNVWRSKVRTITVTLLIGLAMCLSITMMAINSAVEARLGEVEASVGTQIEIRPAGTFGAFGRGEPLDASILEGMDSLPHIIEVAPVVIYQYIPRIDMSNRESAMAAMRNRLAIMGIVPGQPLRAMGSDPAELISGRNFTVEDDNTNVLIVGKTFAEDRGMALGDMVELSGETFEIVGLSQAGNRFADSSVFLPLSTAQRILDMEGKLSQVYVTVDTLSNLSGVISALQALVGDAADVVSQGEAAIQRVAQSMDLIRGTTTTGLWLALGTCWLVIFFTMLLIIRERQREIGILKAIGSSNLDLLSGFAWESLAIAVLGAIVGIVLFTTAGQAIAARVMAQALPSPQGLTGMAQRFPGLQGALGNAEIRERASRFIMQGGFLQSQLGNISVNLSLTLLSRSLGAAIGLGLLGGLLPALYALRLKPAEVLRNE